MGFAMAVKAIARQGAAIGAGIAGLAAAKALSDFFEHVVVLERDSLSDWASHWPGTPQSRHAHGCLSEENVRSASCFRALSATLLQQAPSRSE